MLRDQLKDSLTTAMRSQDRRRTATLRLILAALKDRDIAARTKGQGDGISDQEILEMLQTMVKQRRESISQYEQGGRLELAQQEQEEIAIIEDFLPRQMNDAEIREAVRATIAEIGAGGVKDMGRVMAELRQRYVGRMNFGKASTIAREELA